MNKRNIKNSLGIYSNVLFVYPEYISKRQSDNLFKTEY